MHKYLTLMLVIFVSMHSIIADELDTQVCNAKLLQVLKPDYPITNYQGYSVVSFNIDKSGRVSDIKSNKSMCAISRNNDGSINFKKCPFFKTTSISAAKYLKYAEPKDNLGNSCEIKNFKIKYNYSLYNLKVINNNFLLREENNSNDLEAFLNQNKNYKSEYNNSIYEINTVK